MADKFPSLAADPYRFLMEVYDHEGRLMDVRTPSFPPMSKGVEVSLPLHMALCTFPCALNWALEYVENTPSAARIRISSLSQVCWVGGKEDA